MPIQQGSGNAQLPFIESYDPRLSAVATGTLSSNTAYLVRFRVAKPVTLGAISIWVATASGNVDVGLYSDAVGDGATLTRLTSAGSTAAVGASALQKLTFTAVTLVPGVDYYLAYAVDNGTAAVGRVAGTAAITGLGNLALTKGTSFPLPSSIASPSGGSTTVFMYASLS